jgi:hypothetical protein
MMSSKSESKVPLSSGPLGYKDVKVDISIPIYQEEKKIQNLYDYNLYVNSLTDPYLVTEDYIPTCKENCCFYICRGPSFVYKFIAGLITSLFYCLSFIICPCKCKTYGVLSDEDLTEIFDQPLDPFMQETKEGYEFSCPEYDKIKDKLFPPYKCEGLTVKWDKEKKLQSITIDKTVYTPEDEKLNNGWSSAKVHTMLNAQNKLRFGTHPYWHFSQHAWDYLFDKYFDNSHILSKLVNPHRKHQKYVDNSVSISAGSVLNSGSSACCCWDIQMAEREGIQGIIRHNSRFFLPLLKQAPNKILQPYYLAINTFILKVLEEKKEEVMKDKEKMEVWFKTLCHYLGYEKLEVNIENLATIITHKIFTTSVVHSSEHYIYSQLSTKTFPMALKMEASKLFYFPLCSFRLVGLGDFLKTNMYYYMFTKWVRNRLFCCLSDSRLTKVNYDIDMKETINDFKQSLYQAERESKEKYPKYYFPIDECACSIEF